MSQFLNSLILTITESPFPTETAQTIVNNTTNSEKIDLIIAIALFLIAVGTAIGVCYILYQIFKILI